jgi:hypothetical protein
MNRRATLPLTTMALLCLVLATALPQIGFAQTKMVGTWKLNLTKSQYSPGPAPKSSTIIFEAVGQGFRGTIEGIDAQGNLTKAVFGVFFLDGKSYPVTGFPAYDAVSIKQINDSTWESTRTKAGKVVQTGTDEISADGKTRTFTATGVNENGQQINNVAVYDKQ